MKKIVIATTALLAVSLAACGNQRASSGSDSGAVAQGVTDTEIKLGTTEPLSGGAATAGAGFKAGLEAAIAEKNADGGINGRKLSISVLDDGFTPARSVANIRRLGEQDKVFGILSPAGTANLPGSWPYIKQTDLPVFGPVLPPDPDLPSVFTLATSQLDQTRVIADFLAEKGVKTVGLVGQDNDLGASLTEGMDQQAAKAGLTVVGSEKTEPNSTDVSAAVLNLRKADPDAVVMATDNTQTALILKQAQQIGWKPVFIGNSSTVGAGSSVAVGPAGTAADNVYGTMVVDLPTSDTPEVAAWKAAPGTAADSTGAGYSLQAYATAQVFFGILEKMGDDLSWDNFQKTAENTKDLEVGLLPPVSFGALPGGHSGTVAAKVAQYTSAGGWTVVTPDWISPK